MSKHSINTYDQALNQIKANGHLFDCGRLMPKVRTQLFMAIRLGQIRAVRDTYPIRGFAHTPDQEVKMVFELVIK